MQVSDCRHLFVERFSASRAFLTIDPVAKKGKKIIYTNIGNPHAVGQKPITYYRQVMSLCDLPSECGVKNPAISSFFPEDVVMRAIEMREAIGPAGTGAYTNSQVRFPDHSDSP